MKIYNSLVLQWDGIKYVKVSEDSYEYVGPVVTACGATSAQKTLATTSTSAYNTALSQAQQIFGSASGAFSTLMKSFSPTIAAGPGQNGFNAQQTSNLNSQAITQTGQSYKNAKQALGEAQATSNGVAPGGANIAQNDSLVEGAANQTANQLSQITQAGYAQGNQNYNAAVTGAENATGVFSAATNATGAATGSGNTASTATNNVAQANQGPWQLAAGALGGVVGAATPGVTKSILGG